MFFSSSFFLPKVIIEIQSGNGVLNRIVPCIKCMELSCRVLHCHFGPLLLPYVKKMMTKKTLLFKKNLGFSTQQTKPGASNFKKTLAPMCHVPFLSRPPDICASVSMPSTTALSSWLPAKISQCANNKSAKKGEWRKTLQTITVILMAILALATMGQKSEFCWKYPWIHASFQHEVATHAIAQTNGQNVSQNLC